MLLVAAAALIGIGEFFSLKSSRLSPSLKTFGYLWSLLIIFGAYTGGAAHMLGTLAGGVLLTLLIRLKNGEELKGAVDDAGYLFAGILYVVLLLSYLILLRDLDHGNLWVLLLFFVVWGGDTAAYYSGRSFGRRKLYEKVSPKKSVEGFIGGYLGGIGTCLIIKIILFPVLTLVDAVIIAAVIGVIGPLGDLCESMFKRDCDVKDSGVLIPGHGGILDRMDSILFSAPFVYYFVVLRYGSQV